MLLEAAARRGCAGWINRGCSFLNMLNFPVKVDDKSCSIGHASLWKKHSIACRYFSHKVTYERISCLEFPSPVAQSGKVVCANSQDLRFGSLKFFDTSLVSSEFFRSTTCKGRGKEGDHHSLLASKIRQGDWLALRTRQGEVRRYIPDFQMRLGRSRWLRGNSYCE